jgi:hypothetical protein
MKTQFQHHQAQLSRLNCRPFVPTEQIPAGNLDARDVQLGVVLSKFPAPSRQFIDGISWNAAAPTRAPAAQDLQQHNHNHQQQHNHQQHSGCGGRRAMEEGRLGEVGSGVGGDKLGLWGF